MATAIWLPWGAPRIPRWSSYVCRELSADSHRIINREETPISTKAIMIRRAGVVRWTLPLPAITEVGQFAAAQREATRAISIACSGAGEDFHRFAVQYQHGKFESRVTESRESTQHCGVSPRTPHVLSHQTVRQNAATCRSWRTPAMAGDQTARGRCYRIHPWSGPQGSRCWSPSGRPAPPSCSGA